MIVVCKNCDTRFNLQDDRIPAGGAKVRCSCCSHAFHVGPPRSDASPGRREDTQPAGSEEPSGLAEDSHLENPEFLYEVDDPDDSDEDDAEEGVFGVQSDNLQNGLIQTPYV